MSIEGNKGRSIVHPLRHALHSAITGVLRFIYAI